MRVEKLGDAEAVAAAGAALIAAECDRAVRQRGRFVMAVSGGSTPWIMLGKLVDHSIPWDRFHLAQVDERVAPAGHLDRNLTHLQSSLLDHVPIPPNQLYAMPVEASDLNAAAAHYAMTLQALAGSPSVFDVVHLGLGADGHTASLVPGDRVLDVTDTDVALTGEYQGRRRMTMTFPLINRARRIVWLVTGADKAEPFAKLIRRDTSIPAGRIQQDHTVVLADRAACEQIGQASNEPSTDG